ncbi:aminotransferase class I/II-fold pyridoxal phosphate-dependent enzyme [Candidatus Berkiella aquae]|uniref:DegT/DnrJ/EryC1/StrS family aminotransferase n=1 Tax=Candidatus Berkiella aquae TaxID=295108 RepID=A0A0Q9YI46_9GAMM|nr:DegT/DnrJ/EryC1/StrS family aminotransferase [Candidatus Berkiella aquae]MCS5712315.1 DegT/DnrJ/EryC1/StrS family aminotransferase [Candidatus Berkiella aquae]
MDNYIAVNTPLLNGNEKKYLNECIDTGWISSEGPFVKALEEQFAQKMGRSYGIAVCNGTVALELALKAIDIQPGDEIIMPTFTIISCALAAVRLGAKPVLVDSDPITWNMAVDQIEAKITSRTKAIMVVHTYGLPVDMNPVLALAQKYQLKIVEDAAEMHGQTYYGKPCGSFGEISTFSFYPNKLVTTGEGGMVVTDDPAIRDKCQLLRNLAFEPKQRYLHEELGWNFRMSNLQAAVGVAQLERMAEFIERKHAMGQRYDECLKEIEGIQRPLAATDYAKNIYWVYGIVLDDDLMNGKALMQALHAQGIGSRAFFYPMHQQPVLLKMGLFANESYPVAERLARQGIYIPSGLALTQDEITSVSDKLKKILAKASVTC